VKYPGENSYNQAQKNTAMIEIKDNLIDELNELAHSSGVINQVRKYATENGGILR
jgi:LDH2 family malate/lactate/ureidoglycolate dehydrogenase